MIAIYFRAMTPTHCIIYTLLEVIYGIFQTLCFKDINNCNFIVSSDHELTSYLEFFYENKLSYFLQ